MHIPEIEIYPTRRPWARRDIEIYITRFDVDKQIAQRGKLTFETVAPGLAETESDIACTITNNQAQSLMDRLWDCGIRPTEGQGSAGQISAVEKHLADMRTIAMGAAITAGLIPKEPPQ